MDILASRRKHAFDSPAQTERTSTPLGRTDTPVGRAATPLDAKDSKPTCGGIKDGYFEIFIQPNADAAWSSSGSETASSSGRSGHVVSGVNFNETYIHMKCTQSVYEALWRKSLRLRGALEHALALQRNYLTLFPEPDHNIDYSSLAFMIRNLHRDAADYASGVTLEDLTKLANTLWTYRCNPACFVHGWKGLHQDYRTARRTPPVPGASRNGGVRSWWAQPKLWGAGSRTPLRLLIIAYVFSACDDSLNSVLASELITAVWDSHVQVASSVPEIEHIEEYRTQECAQIFEDFKNLTASSGETKKDFRMKQLRTDISSLLDLDFEANCFESAHDAVANQNFAILNTFTPYDLLRDMESIFLGKQPDSPSGNRRARRKSSIATREYPRDPPDIKWKKVGSSVMSAFAGTFDSDVKAQKEEVAAILDRMEMLMHQRQLALLEQWTATRDNHHKKLLDELEGVFPITLAL